MHLSPKRAPDLASRGRPRIATQSPEERWPKSPSQPRRLPYGVAAPFGRSREARNWCEGRELAERARGGHAQEWAEGAWMGWPQEAHAVRRMPELSEGGSSGHPAAWPRFPASPSSSDGRLSTLQREAQSLLNKISPDNEAPILRQMAAFALEDAEDFKRIAELTIAKAIKDPFYSEIYARVLRKLSLEYAVLPRRVEGAGGEARRGGGGAGPRGAWGITGFASFAETVLDQCSRTFESFFGPGEELSGLDAEEAEAPRTRRRAQAFVRLLGYLYKGHMVDADFLEPCLNRLLLIGEGAGAPLARPPRAWIECACELMLTVGKELSRQEQGRAILRAATEALCRWKELRRPGPEGGGAPPAFAYPPRIRFLIQDTAEAGWRGWPSKQMDVKGVPEKATCSMPVRLKQDPGAAGPGGEARWP